MRPDNLVRLTVLIAAVILAFSVSPIASGDPESASATGRLDHIDKVSDRRWEVDVYSPSMDKVIPLQVLRPADTSQPRSTLYLLNGAGAGEDGANWLRQTDIASFFADKNVNVVIPTGGYLSYYTDWRNDDPVLGRNKWQTFMTKELPSVVDEALGTDGVNAIGGLSMSGGSVLDFAIQAPGLYKAVASFSGCAKTSDPIGQNVVRAIVEGVGRGNTVNMWGPIGDPEWVRHDPYINADRLRGVAIFVYSATGVPGPYESLYAKKPPDAPPLPDQIVVGGGIEAASNFCSHLFADRLAALGIPATFDFRPAGTHSWLYWQDALRSSWTVLGPALGE